MCRPNICLIIVRACASLAPNGSHLAVSNMFRGFDVYRLPSEEHALSFEHVDRVFPVPSAQIPVLFVHGGRALLGGSMSGKVGLWHLSMGIMHTLTLSSAFFCGCIRVSFVTDLHFPQGLAKFSQSM